MISKVNDYKLIGNPKNIYRLVLTHEHNCTYCHRTPKTAPFHLFELNTVV